MAREIVKLRHQLEIAQTLAKSHINFVVIPIIEATDEPFLVRLQVERLERLVDVSERQTEG